MRTRGWQQFSPSAVTFSGGNSVEKSWVAPCVLGSMQFEFRLHFVTGKGMG